MNDDACSYCKGKGATPASTSYEPRPRGEALRVTHHEAAPCVRCQGTGVLKVTYADSPKKRAKGATHG